MTSVEVVIPYREDTACRAVNADVVCVHLHQVLPDAAITRVDSFHEPFSLSASRNLGVRNAVADVVVVCDADCLVPEGPLLEAIGAAGDGRIHYPFTATRWIDVDGEVAGHGGIANGGVMVCTPAAWWAAGGMDENFIGWGGEDDAFALAAERLTGPVVRHEGTMQLLMHPRPEGAWNGFANPHYAENLERLRAYQEADVDETRRLVGLGG